MQAVNAKLKALEGKQTAQPKKKNRKVRQSNKDMMSVGVFPNEFSRGYQSPRITSNGDGGSRIKGKEIILTLSATFLNGVSVESFGKKNISFLTCFSWLSSYALLYDLYKFNNLKFYFQPALSTVYSGNVGIYFDPGVEETEPSTFVVLSNNYNSVTSSIHQPTSINVRGDILNRLNWFEVRGGTSSPEVTSVGSFIYGISTLSAVTTISGEMTVGYIWADYDVSFKNPTDPLH